MKLKDCTNFSEGFVRIMKEKNIEVKLSYRLAKIQRKCESELAPMQAVLKLLAEDSYVKDDKGVKILPPENMEILMKKQSELLEEEVNFEFEPLPIALIEACEFIEPQIMYFFLPFIDDKNVVRLGLTDIPNSKIEANTPNVEVAK